MINISIVTIYTYKVQVMMALRRAWGHWSRRDDAKSYVATKSWRATTKNLRVALRRT